MIVDCHSCGATYNISDEKVRGRRVRVRCKSCGEGIIVDGNRIDSDEATRVYSPNFEPAAYGVGVHDEATRVMSPSGPDLEAAAAVGEWTVAVSESDQRTMDLAELISAFNGGLVPDEALVWREGMEDWLPIRQVPEIQAAIESNEATHVVSPAIAVRAPRRAAGDRAVARRAEPEPARARARIPSIVEEPAPAPAPALSPTPERRPAPVAPSATARVRQGRAGSTDLFGNIENAGADEALLNSTALTQYDDKPIGARNESSVLFSLDALKAGARRGSSAPPRAAAHSPQTAADILGMNAGGALPGMSAAGALLSAPAVDAPLEAVAPAMPPPRSRMDTLPPTMRSRRSWAMPAVVVAGAVVVGTIAVAVLRARVSQPTVAATEPSAEPAKRVTPPTTPVVATAEPAAPSLPVADTAPTPAEPPAAAAQAAHNQGDGVTAPVIPSKPSTTTNTSTASFEAMKAALRPEKTEPAPKTAAEPATGKGTQKVVLAEESGETAGELPDEKPEEPAKPPFDTSAAKAALEAASSSAASCKKDDGPTGRGKVQVTFSPAGRATSANVIEGPFGGTNVGSCVAKIFRGAKVPPFSGEAVTVSKSFTIAE